MFKYHVDLNAYAYMAGGQSNKITKADIEEVVKYFEQNVNYGIAAYVRSARTGYGYEFVDKPEVEILAGAGGIS